MKKTLSLLLAALLLALCLAGCSSAGTPAQNKTESTGNSEAVGVCFTDGSEISLLSLMNGGYADYDLDVTGTVESDGSLSLVNDGETRLFTPLKQG